MRFRVLLLITSFAAAWGLRPRPDPSPVPPGTAETREPCSSEADRATIEWLVDEHEDLVVRLASLRAELTATVGAATPWSDAAPEAVRPGAVRAALDRLPEGFDVVELACDSYPCLGTAAFPPEVDCADAQVLLGGAAGTCTPPRDGLYGFASALFFDPAVPISAVRSRHLLRTAWRPAPVSRATD